MKKKLFSMFMAIAMILCLAVPAFADDPPTATTTKTSNLAGDIVEPTVTVTMPTTTNKLILNPYKLKITTSDAATGDDAALADATDQVLSVGLAIKNESTAPVKVGLKAVATGATLTFANKPCTGKEATKSVFAFVELLKGTSDTAPTTGWAKPADVNAKVYPQLVFVGGTDGVENAAIETLPAGSTTANYLYYKIGGNSAIDPTGGWTSSDTLAVALTFSFTPTVPKAIAFPTDDATTMGALADISNAAAAMGSTVYIAAKDGKTLSTVTAQDADGANVAVTTVTAGKLYTIKVPATDVEVSVTAAA